MKTNKPHHRLLAVMLTAFAALGLVNPAHAYDVYRSVLADAGGAVVWAAANFGVSGAPPTLSFFHFADDNAARQGLPAAQCFVKVDLANTGANPLVGAQDTVGNVGIPVGGAAIDQPQPFPWAITFDNNPAGHWSIDRAQISTVGTNAAASRVAASGFHNLATTPASGVTIIDGTVAGCHA